MGRTKKPEPENEWEQLANESAEAYEAFALYRDMAYQTVNSKGETVYTDYVSAKRSVRTVCQLLDKSLTLISRWSAKYRWVERAQAYDKYIDKKALARATRDRVTERENQIRLWTSLEKEAYKSLSELFENGADEVKRNPKILLALLEKSSNLLNDRHEAKEATEKAKHTETEDSALTRLDEVLREVREEARK